MTKRRSLTDGLKSSPKADPKKETAFVFGRKTSKAAEPKPTVETPTIVPATQPEQPVGRSPLTTRLRADIGAALKRASLERELSGQTPHTVQDILDAALEPWLKANGYLK